MTRYSEGKTMKEEGHSNLVMFLFWLFMLKIAFELKQFHLQRP